MSKQNKVKLIFSIPLTLTFLVFFVYEPTSVFAQQAPVTINAHKIVCTSEEDLPDWGDGEAPGTIDSITATDFVSKNDNCEFVEDWAFQWGFHDKEEGIVAGVDKLVGNHIGIADGTTSVCDYNCGVNTATGTAYNEWKNFDSSTGAGSTPAEAVIEDLQDSPGIWVREVLPENYIPYTYPPKGSAEDSVTAELYCHTDIMNFDNYDLVSSPNEGQTYYCVGFNVLQEQEPIDVCPNIEGIQEELPYGYEFDREGNCIEIEDEEETPELIITKSNDTSGNDKKTGGTVTYTITVTLKAGSPAITSVEVIDLPPEGFTYVEGSWTSNSSVRGDLKAANTTTEPTYASPGTWLLGNMVEGETVELTYAATIENTVDPGLYKDLAWARGTFGADSVLANKNSGIFVGTEVNVIVDVTHSEDVEVNEEKVELIEEVLGASTVRPLPATGTRTLWVMVSGLLFIFGASMLSVGIAIKSSRSRRYIKVLVFLILTAVFSFGFSSKAFAANLTARIEEPKSPTNDSTFSINFVALDVLGKDVTAKCMLKRPGESTYAQFGPDILLTSGGGSSNCSVGDSEITSNGAYAFFVKVVTEDESADSSTVTVVFDNDRPGQPRTISKKRIDSCTYEIKIKTAKDDGDTASVRLYRSDEKEFEANTDTHIKTYGVGSNETLEREVERPECGKKYYFAAIAFDAAGNASKPKVETVEDTEITTISVEPSVEAGQGPIPVQGGSVLSSNSSGSVNTANDNGEVLSETDQNGENSSSGEDSDTMPSNMEDATNIGSEDSTRTTFAFWLLIVLVVIGIFYDFFKRRSQE